MPRAGSPYNYRYMQERLALLATGPACQLRLTHGPGTTADSADHWPPLAQHRHVPGSGCCRLLPACQPCQKVQGLDLARQAKAANRALKASARGSGPSPTYKASAAAPAAHDSPSRGGVYAPRPARPR